jgi:ADP-ribose pyrophosphatase YjhB (NUDIX family)
MSPESSPSIAPHSIVIVVLSVVQSAGRLLLVQESKADFREQWNLPGGRLEPGETVQQGAVREALEESGIEIRLTGLLAIDQRIVEPGHGPDRLRIVFAAEASGGTLKRLADEHSLRADWFDPAELDRLHLRTPFVQRMASLAAQQPALLPLSSVGVMTAGEGQRERRAGS